MRIEVNTASLMDEDAFAAELGILPLSSSARTTHLSVSTSPSSFGRDLLSPSNCNPVSPSSSALVSVLPLSPLSPTTSAAYWEANNDESMVQAPDSPIDLESSRPVHQHPVTPHTPAIREDGDFRLHVYPEIDDDKAILAKGDRRGFDEHERFTIILTEILLPLMHRYEKFLLKNPERKRAAPIFVSIDMQEHNQYLTMTVHMLPKGGRFSIYFVDGAFSSGGDGNIYLRNEDGLTPNGKLYEQKRFFLHFCDALIARDSSSDIHSLRALCVALHHEICEANIVPYVWMDHEGNGMPHPLMKEISNGFLWLYRTAIQM